MNINLILLIIGILTFIIGFIFGRRLRNDAFKIAILNGFSAFDYLESYLIKNITALKRNGEETRRRVVINNCKLESEIEREQLETILYHLKQIRTHDRVIK